MDRRLTLVVAPAGLSDVDVRELVRQCTSTDNELLVLVPVRIDRLHYWTSDDRRAREEAEDRLQESLDALGRDKASGVVGEPDALQAIADALALFTPDDVVVARGVERDLVARAQRRFSVPVGSLGES
jgi:UDP-N-acetylmuramyl tripeptide synthase